MGFSREIIDVIDEHQQISSQDNNLISMLCKKQSATVRQLGY